MNGIVANELVKQGNGASQFIIDNQNPAEEPPNQSLLFVSPPQKRVRLDDPSSASSLGTSSTSGGASWSGSFTSGDQYVEATTRRLEDAIRASAPREEQIVAARDPERDRLQTAMLEDEAATKKINKQIAELQLLKLQKEMGLI